MLNPDFNSALRIMLTVSKKQMRFATTSMSEILEIPGMDYSVAMALVRRLVLAHLLDGNERGYQTARSPDKISLAEIYEAATPIRDLPRTTLEELHFVIAERAHEAAITELKGLDLSHALADVFGDPAKERFS